MLSERAKSLWAKKRTVDGQPMWLPLVAHLVDASNVSRMLFNQWLSDQQRVFLTVDQDVDKTLKLVKFVGFIHDIGKATPAFQTKKSYVEDASLDADLIEKAVRTGFVGLDSTHLPSASKSPHAKAGEAILERLAGPDSIGAIVGGHHGRPLTRAPQRDIGDYTSNYWQAEKDPVVQQRWQDVQLELLNYGLEISGFKSVAELPMISQPQAVLLEGLLIMADWLSSSEALEDDPGQPLFPLISLDQGLDDLNLTARYQQAWTRWQRTDEWPTAPVPLASDPYKLRWGFSARPVQRKVAEMIDQAEDPGMVIIEAPMGMGKTEAALVAAEQLAYKGKETGLFFGLPTQATANAMFDRVDEWLRRLAADNGETYSIKLMHSKAEFNPNYLKVPVAEDVDGDASVVVNRWFSGKKSILDEFSIGTIDNLLQMDLKQKHLALKHLGLSKKVVIIDEVHAYDSFMDQHLFRTLEWLGTYHVPIVVLSATLPKATRNRLLEAYFHGKFGQKLSKGADLSGVSSDWQDSEAYPLVSMLDGRRLNQVSHFDGKTNQSQLSIHVERMSGDLTALGERVLDAIADGGVAGVIVNTIKRAQALADALAGKVPFIVLHSAFVAAQRAQLETELQNAIGKGSKRPAKLVVIGTQVLEQSLDIDFDILFTDIAPMDLLLQRAGRLHRHAIARPRALTGPRLVVTGIEGLGEFEEGSAAIYGQYLLMKTEALLPATLRLPDDISRLVQTTYDLQRDPPLPGIEEERTRFETKIAQKAQKAQAFQIAPPSRRRSRTLHGWLDNDQPGVDVSEQRAEAAVRDIDESLEVILLQHTKHGDALIDGRVVDSFQLDRMAKVIAQQTIRLPRVFTFNIDATIKALEQETARLYPGWQQNKWLRGALALPLDEELNGSLMDYQLHYSLKDGLRYWKEDQDGNETV